MADSITAEDRIQSLANILSLLAIVGGMDKAAVQRVLITLGSQLIDAPSEQPIPPDLAGKLLVLIAREEGHEAAMRVASDFDFIARSWEPVLEEYFATDAHRLMPYAEIIYQLYNYSAFTLHDYGAFERFGGTDLVLPMPQLTAALKTYAVPGTGLVWEIVGFDDPPDQALVASSYDTMYLFKAAATHVDLRFSELERNAESGPRHEHDVRVDAPLFGAFVSGMMGDMLYWAARLRADALSGRQTWKRIKSLIVQGIDGPPVLDITEEPAPAPTLEDTREPDQSLDESEPDDDDYDDETSDDVPEDDSDEVLDDSSDPEADEPAESD